ncbi:MAG TPA: CRISPR-associated RAMP protein Csx10 [Oscillatoriaceae cyanobacterium M33_DOE_052]|uniref:CRISPR-associated RAMP protein Csx10 n=1 Tax=Planktothricoides sp. SpSt-374 TaxID=2282167 RepID=A0A7C3ZZL9_9CYAN|nr:CRISPR-associated RAMP protein Csx10 [Oscillatoriaceae cyanobacterium M33_DOE_052]
MKQIKLQIKALSPLAIGQKKAGVVSEAGDYIPGAVIRGTIAGEILQQAQQPLRTDFSQAENHFQSLFLGENAAIFHNAYPADANEAAPVWVMPATALSSKTKPGFKSGENYGVFDSLIDRFCAERCGHPYDPSCPTDGGRVEPYGGFYSTINGAYHKRSVSKRLLTRVGINRRRATAEEQILYSIEVLNEVQGEKKESVVYRSAILVEDNDLAELLAQFINARNFRLGGGASRGLGKVEISADVEGVNLDTVTRVDKFNQELSKRWRTWENIFGAPQTDGGKNRTYFSLDLQSDAILTNKWRRTMVISPEMLCQFADVSDPSLNLEVAYSSYDYRSGWNAAWGLMKDMELITNKGAVYLFSTELPDAWKNAWNVVELKGVGERTAEGFGQVRICHEFHLVFREEPA